MTAIPTGDESNNVTKKAIIEFPEDETTGELNGPEGQIRLLPDTPKEFRILLTRIVIKMIASLTRR